MKIIQQIIAWLLRRIGLGASDPIESATAGLAKGVIEGVDVVANKPKKVTVISDKDAANLEITRRADDADRRELGLPPYDKGSGG